MHSLAQIAYAQAVAADRARPVARVVRSPRRERPPTAPLRARAAYAAGRFARRLDAEMARRAVV
jgi:hypothetical protein